MAKRRPQRTDGTALEFFARCAGGFEEVLGRELRALGMARVRPQVGGVIFFGTVSDGYRACLWSRVATRIQLVLARVPAQDADALYQGVYAIAWEDHVREGSTIAVDAHGENPNLRNTKFVALKVKDALCDRLRNVRGSRPDVDASDPDFSVNVAVHPQRATVYLNLSGASLHRRGYRTDGVQTEAPLKETLAASVLLAAGWDDLTTQGGSLVDPMCGSGTLAIEAALVCAHRAPGLLREKWGFEGWLSHDEALWESIRAKAEEQIVWEGGIPPIVAGDLDARAVEIARENARRAGVEDLIRFHVDDAANLGRYLRALRKRGNAPGLLAANPPYGARLLTRRELPAAYEALSNAVEAVPANWRVALITPDASIDSALGRPAERTIACHNGPIETRVRLYERSETRRTLDVTSLSGATCKIPVAEDSSAQFAARLRKVGRERMRWARRSDISCLRIYDADLPDYALSVDLYQGSGTDEGTRFAEVVEHRRPGSVDAERAIRRLADAAAIVAATLDVPRENVLVRPWQDARHGTSRAQERSEELVLSVREAGLSHRIDLNGRPDSGLPLHLRGVRDFVASHARGGRVANLFATTGAATLRAAAAGAASTVTIDAFADRVEAIKCSMADNALSGRRHAFACADARTWLARERAKHHTYDLIVCVPPAWMGPAQGSQRPFELQRDHAELLTLACSVLAPGGVCVFACLQRSFELDEPALASAGISCEDVSARTLPADFVRSERDWHCYLLRRQKR